MRADRLARREREALRLVDAALEQQELGEAALALAERGAVLERRQDPDRLAEEPLGTGDVALVACDPSGEVQRPAKRPGGSGLGQVFTRRIERDPRLVEVAARDVKLARESKRPSSGLRTPGLLREQQRLLDERLGPVDLQAGQVDAGELVCGLALEVFAARLPCELQRLEHDFLFLGQVATRPGDRRPGAQSAEAAGEVVRLERAAR